MSNNQTVNVTDDTQVPEAHQTNLTEEITVEILEVVNTALHSSFYDCYELQSCMLDCSPGHRAQVFDANLQLEIQKKVGNVNAVGEFLMMSACLGVRDIHPDIRFKMDPCKRLHWSKVSVEERSSVNA